MSEWHPYRLVPEDVLFFRDGKPSTILLDHYLRSIFPPFPSTLYGLVRTQRLLEAGCDLSSVTESWWKQLPPPLRAEIGEWGGFGTLELRGPWLVDGETMLLPAPADLQIVVARASSQDEPRKVTRVGRLIPAPEDRERKNWSHELAAMRVDWSNDAPTDEKYESAAGWYLKPDGMKRWMEGALPAPNDFIDWRALWKEETRTGVGLQKDRRLNETGMLYTFGFIRVARGVSIGFELRGGSLGTGCHVRLGAENRLASLEAGPSLTSAIVKTSDSATDEGVFALVSPAIFKSGSRPDANVTAAVVGDRIHIGGWDLARRRPKPLRRAVPAGSVYWINGQSIATMGSLSEQAHEGFGLMLRGIPPRGNHG